MVKCQCLRTKNYQGATEFNIETSATSTINYDNIKFTSTGGGGNYANPHAATTIGGNAQTYDKNGNLLFTPTLENTWNYRNELTQSIQNNATTAYIYDHQGQRISKTTGTSSTLYPFSNYEIKNGAITKHIYLNDTLIATIEEDTPAPSIYYNHQDHLNSTNAVTDKDGYLNQVLSYQPFGDTRIDNQYDTVNQTKRYTGHDYDEETSLSYMGARYYDGQTGRFTSQDPVSLALGDWKTVQDKTGNKLGFYIQNPQTHNSYSYAFNNPINYTDSNGEFAFLALPIIYAPQILAATAALATPLGAMFLAEDINTLTNNPDGLDIALVVAPGVIGNAGKVAKVSMSSNAWSAGRVGNSQQSLANHFAKHGESLGVKSTQEYYDRASNALKPDSGFTKLSNKNGSVDYYNPQSKELVGVNKNNEISTYHKVTNTNKAEGLDNRVKKKQNENNGR